MNANKLALGLLISAAVLLALPPLGPGSRIVVDLLALAAGLGAGRRLLLQFRQTEALRRDLERTRRELALLAESERRLRIVFETANSAIVVADEKGRVIECNQRFARSLESTPEALVGLQLPPQRRQSEIETDSAYIREIFEGKRDGYVHEKRTVLPSGEPMWRNINLAARRDAQGRVTNLVALVTDVSERKQEEHEHILRDSLARQSARLGMWEWHLPSGRITVDERWAGLLGYRVDELAPTLEMVQGLSHPDDWRLLIDHVRPHFSGISDGYVFEHRMRHKDGHWVWIHDTGQVLERDGQDRPMRLIGLYRDISEAKQTEEVLRAAKDSADAANRSKSEFLANMSHEIRTPMNAILGLTRTVLAGDLQARQRDRLGKVMASSQALLRILNDILDYSKIEAGCMVLESTPFNFDEAMHGVADLFGGQIEQKGLTLDFERADGVPAAAIGDPLRLTQILNNLVGNAIKFTETGAIRVRVEALPSDAGEGSVVPLRFSVHDTGIGLTKEQAGRLFQAFTQADNSVTRKYGGTGLGLTICQRLVTLMGGEISVVGEPGVGCTFAFTARFERCAADAVLPGARPLPSLAGDDSVPSFPGLQVLLVEDNALNQEVATDLLRGMGLNVSVADDGAQALLRIEHEHFDLVLMDLHMPVMGGLEAARRIPSLLRGRTLPVIAMTAAVLEEDRSECLATGMADFVAKPIDPDDLARALRRWLPVGKVAAAPGASAIGVATPGPVPTPMTTLSPAPKPKPKPMSTGTPTSTTTPSATPVPSTGLPIVLAGFDPTVPLRMLRGNRERFSLLLQGFAQQQADAVARLDRLRQAHDAHGLAHELHTLKGLAGTLGMTRQAKLAQQLEAEHRRGEPLASYDAFTQSLTEALAALAPLSPSPCPALDHAVGAAVDAAKLSINPERARQMLEQLNGYLQEQELIPDELTEALQQCARSQGDGSLYERLNQQIFNFEHDAALRTLADIECSLDA